ncbi:hypothetical protein [Victivallis sp. Marseille-Q1083]|uniref:hypothetical protein n=1 Tax=Victivallis sp. Marseille-Q1083 TaxID=2717288 RepID=UPI00158F4F7D|nr:hypothetical protein [Victivallis sp. Marseille-Q1083]
MNDPLKYWPEIGRRRGIGLPAAAGLNAVIAAVNERNKVLSLPPLPYLGLGDNLEFSLLAAVHQAISSLFDFFLPRALTPAELEYRETFPHWTESELLAAIGEPARLVPVYGFPADAAWLYQAWKMLNLLTLVEIPGFRYEYRPPETVRARRSCNISETKTVERILEDLRADTTGSNESDTFSSCVIREKNCRCQIGAPLWDFSEAPSFQCRQWSYIQAVYYSDIPIAYPGLTAGRLRLVGQTDATLAPQLGAVPFPAADALGWLDYAEQILRRQFNQFFSLELHQFIAWDFAVAGGFRSCDTGSETL